MRHVGQKCFTRTYLYCRVCRNLKSWGGWNCKRRYCSLYAYVYEVPYECLYAYSSRSIHHFVLHQTRFPSINELTLQHITDTWHSFWLGLMYLRLYLVFTMICLSFGIVFRSLNFFTSRLERLDMCFFVICVFHWSHKPPPEFVIGPDFYIMSHYVSHVQSDLGRLRTEMQELMNLAADCDSSLKGGAGYNKNRPNSQTSSNAAVLQSRTVPDDQAGVFVLYL